MIRKISAVFIVVLLTIILTSAATAQSEEVVIHPLRDRNKTFTVHVGQVVKIRYGWGAASRGLVQSYINAVDQEHTLNGASLFASSREAKQYWGPIEPATPATVALCPNKPQDTLFFSYWVYRLPDLPPGAYNLHTDVSVNHPMIDGCDWDGDGKLDRGDASWWSTITIIVE